MVPTDSVASGSILASLSIIPIWFLICKVRHDTDVSWDSWLPPGGMGVTRDVELVLHFASRETLKRKTSPHSSMV